MRYPFYAIIFVLLLITGCSTDPLDVDVSDIELDLEFERFEQKMFEATSPQEMTAINKELIDFGGELYEFYVFELLRSGSVYDDSIGTYLYYFVKDSSMEMAYEDISAEFRDFETEQDQIINMFKHLKYHLPDEPMPTRVITYNSAFNYGVISTDSMIGIGLDMYLGQFNRIIQQLGFPIYMKEKMEKEYLPVDVGHSWLATNILGDNPDDTFLKSMIYYGKLFYVLDAMMPDLPDHLKARYTEEEYNWALASEANIWQYIKDMNWVYSTEMKVKLRFFEEAPTTVGIEDSPGRIGRFMGWQMIRQYMEKNEEVTVLELINETSESKFLKTYKPEDE